MMAAIAAAEAGAGDVHVLETTAEPLHKVLISGGGRCNVTHACWDPRALVGHYPRGGQALRGAFSRFASGDAVAWFEAHGLELVEEPDGRLFPRANRSTAVIEVLRNAATAAGVQLHTGVGLRQALLLDAGGFDLELRRSAGQQQQQRLFAQRLVLATGSHPSGRQLAAQLGHRLVPPVPSLFTLSLAGDPLLQLAGLAVDPVAVELRLAAQECPPPPGASRAAGPLAERFRQQGPLLVTHWGLSGPAILRLTAFAARALHAASYRAELRVNWTGNLSHSDLEQYFGQARQQQARRQLANWRPWPELPKRLWWHLLQHCGIDLQSRWADLSKQQQQALISSLRDSRYTVTGRGPFGEEFVTAGGVPLGEVNIASMESRLCPGLHLVGELLDVDGITGGFNFQHCWSSGWLAGQAIAAAR
jgi:predicted Rossmann fold flavoprotein